MAIGGLQEALRQLGHQVTRLSPAHDVPKNLLLRRLRFNAGLPAQLHDHAFDLIVGFDIDGFLLSAKNKRCPFVCSIKGVAAEEALQETGTARWLLGLLSHLEGWNARRADLVLTTSRYCQRAIQRHYGIQTDKIRLVPEGIDPTRWQRLARDLPRHGDGRTILCVARQYRRKRVKDLLRALPAVRRCIPGAHAVVIGAGPEHGRLRKLVRELRLEDAVELLGAVSDDAEVAQYYRQADVFCLPTIQEGFGIVFLEAMAAGLPIVTTSAAAIPEVVPHHRAGVLVPPRDSAALAEALIHLLRDPEKRHSLAAFSAQHVQQFEWPNVARLFLERVEPLLGR